MRLIFILLIFSFVLNLTSQAQDSFVGALIKGRSYCSGIFIAKDKFITAAHCVEKGVGDLKQIKVVVGEDLKHPERIFAVKRIVPHPRSPLMDMAVLFLDSAHDSSVPFASIFEMSDLKKDTEAVVIGYGDDYLGSQQNLKEKKHKIELQLKKWNTREFVFQGKIKGSDTCVGDSGAGLLYERGGEFFLAGIVSRGLTGRCADGTLVTNFYSAVCAYEKEWKKLGVDFFEWGRCLQNMPRVSKKISAKNFCQQIERFHQAQYLEKIFQELMPDLTCEERFSPHNNQLTKLDLHRRYLTNTDFLHLFQKTSIKEFDLHDNFFNREEELLQNKAFLNFCEENRLVPGNFLRPMFGEIFPYENFNCQRLFQFLYFQHRLDFSGLPVGDGRFLTSFPRAKVLMLQDTNLTNLTFLKSLPKLTFLDISFNSFLRNTSLPRRSNLKIRQVDEQDIIGGEKYFLVCKNPLKYSFEERQQFLALKSLIKDPVNSCLDQRYKLSKMKKIDLHRQFLTSLSLMKDLFNLEQIDVRENQLNSKEIEKLQSDLSHLKIIW